MPQTISVGACELRSSRLDRDRLRAVERGEEALEVAHALRRRDERPQIGLDRLVASPARDARTRARAPRRERKNGLSPSIALERVAQPARRRHREKRLEGLRRPVVVHVAVGERQACARAPDGARRR